jgi:hypothetical protein
MSATPMPALDAGFRLDIETVARGEAQDILRRYKVVPI